MPHRKLDILIAQLWTERSARQPSELIPVPLAHAQKKLRTDGKYGVALGDGAANGTHERDTSKTAGPRGLPKTAGRGQ